MINTCINILNLISNDQTMKSDVPIPPINNLRIAEAFVALVVIKQH